MDTLGHSDVNPICNFNFYADAHFDRHTNGHTDSDSNIDLDAKQHTVVHAGSKSYIYASGS